MLISSHRSLNFMCLVTAHDKAAHQKTCRPITVGNSHYDDTRFQFSFARSFESLINAFLNPLPYLCLSTFLAYRARDILDFNDVCLYCRSAYVSLRATL